MHLPTPLRGFVSRYAALHFAPPSLPPEDILLPLFRERRLVLCSHLCMNVISLPYRDFASLSQKEKFPNGKRWGMIQAKLCSLYAQCCLYELIGAGSGTSKLTETQIQSLFVEATKLDNMQPGDYSLRFSVQGSGFRVQRLGFR